MRRFTAFASHLGSFRWWVNRSWKFKVQFLIGTTAFFLFALSIAAWCVYQHEFSKISDNFMRLQLFGPQHVFYSGNSESEAISNPCVYHMETRTPFGNSIPGARVETTLSNANGQPFWHHVDETGADGCLDLRIPNIPMPPRVQLTIHAEEGRKTADLTAFLTASPSRFVVPDLKNAPEPDSDSDSNPAEKKVAEPYAEKISAFQPEFHDRTLSGGSFPILYEYSQNTGRKIIPNAEMTLPERVITAPQIPLLLISRRDEKRSHPIFVGIWQKDVLLACRPFAAGKHARTIKLSIPETVYGLFSVLLVDCSSTPPRVLQHELAYRLPDYDADAETEQTAFLKPFMEKIGTYEFRAEEQQMEFLPLELASPQEEGSETQVLEEKRKILQAAQCLLGSAISENIPTSHRFAVPELQPLSTLCDSICQLTASVSDETKTVSTPENGISAMQESVHEHMAAALKIQSLYLNEKCSSNAAFQVYCRELPIIYDGLVELEKTYNSQLRDFRFNARTRLGSLSCIILCSASCLVVLMLMMSILGLPSDWRVWIFTLLVVLFAFGVSYVISNQADVERHSTNIRYIIFLGENPAEKSENPEEKIL